MSKRIPKWDSRDWYLGRRGTASVHDSGSHHCLQLRSPGRLRCWRWSVAAIQHADCTSAVSVSLFRCSHIAANACLNSFRSPFSFAIRVLSKDDLDQLLSITPSDWATDYSGQWVNYFSLLITVRALERSSATNATASSVGVLHISVRPGGNLTSLDGTSLPCNDSSYLTSGSWGDVVIDAGVAPYSDSALLIWFRSPVLYVPDYYVLQV